MGTKIKNIIVSLLVITINTLCLVVFTTLLKIFLNDFSQLTKIKTETLIRLVTLNNIAAVIIAKFIFYKIQGIFLPNNIFTISNIFSAILILFLPHRENNIFVLTVLFVYFFGSLSASLVNPLISNYNKDSNKIFITIGVVLSNIITPIITIFLFLNDSVNITKNLSKILYFIGVGILFLTILFYFFDRYYFLENSKELFHKNLRKKKEVSGNWYTILVFLILIYVFTKEKISKYKYYFDINNIFLNLIENKFFFKTILVIILFFIIIFLYLWRKKLLFFKNTGGKNWRLVILSFLLSFTMAIKIFLLIKTGIIFKDQKIWIVAWSICDFFISVFSIFLIRHYKFIINNTVFITSLLLFFTIVFFILEYKDIYLPPTLGKMLFIFYTSVISFFSITIISTYQSAFFSLGENYQLSGRLGILRNFFSIIILSIPICKKSNNIFSSDLIAYLFIFFFGSIFIYLFPPCYFEKKIQYN